MLLEAVGDLPSERAMMRTNGMSCVRQDRTVIDVPVQGFAVGEDGKAGLRGLVVSKQGQAISKAMLAGFADGVSRAFGGNNNQMSNLGGGELPSGSDIGTSGVMGGASSALDRIAQHFLDLAEQLHPVIEINSGREVTVILTQGRTMAGRSGAEGRRGEGR
jgi:conjugal transfer pilus assembly protein TraB